MKRILTSLILLLAMAFPAATAEDAPVLNIPTGTYAIEEEAFMDCEGLTSVVIPYGAESIGVRAFYSCAELCSAFVPETVNYIGVEAFAECPKLVVTVAEDSYALQYCIQHQVPYVTVKPVGHFTYESNESDTVTITGYIGNAPYLNVPARLGDKKVTGIADYAFRSRSDLVEVVLPSGLQTIGNEAFFCCAKLTSITLPDTLERIGDWAFFGCVKLPAISLPDSLKAIGGGAFGSCAALTTVTVPSGVRETGIYAFSDCANLTSVELKPGFASVGNGMFLNCVALNSVTIPSSVTFIGNAAFRGCESMTSVVLPAGDITFGENECPFADCPNLILTVIANSKAEQFCKDNHLNYQAITNTLTIPSSVTFIDDGAFMGCESLTRVVLPAGDITFGENENPFANCPNLILIVPAGSKAEQFCIDNHLNYLIVE